MVVTDRDRQVRPRRSVEVQLAMRGTSPADGLSERPCPFLRERTPT